jgi:hypothetical protein
MKVNISGPVTAFHADGRAITKLSELESLHGLGDSEESLANHLDGALAEIGLEGGHLRLVLDASGPSLRVHTEYLSPRRLKKAELDALVEFTKGQWSDGIGEGCFAALQAETGISVCVYPTPHDPASIQATQSPSGAKPARRSPLPAAAAKGNLKRVQSLLRQGEPIEARGQWQFTALLAAVAEQQVEVVEYLLAQGADVHVRTLGGPDSHLGTNCLQLAAMNGNEPVIRRLLDAGADPDTPDGNGMTPLMWAANRGHGTLIRLLSERGADLNGRDTAWGRTALMLAAPERPEVIELLLQLGADPQIRNDDGLNAAEEAAYQADAERRIQWNPARVTAYESKAQRLRSR